MLPGAARLPRVALVCIVASDLHLFSRRARADAHLATLEEAARRARTVVLNGDIVDFRWSRLGGVDATVAAGHAWLERLVALDVDVHYVLGNHDHVPEWTRALDGLAAREPRFRWTPYHLRLGDAVFLHGDVSNPGLDAARLAHFRARFARLEPPSRAMQRTYAGVIALRLHVLGARAVFPERAVLRRLSRYLDDVRHELGDGVRNVYFGHTHLAVDGAEYGGRRFHNGGAAIDGMPFRVLVAELG